MHSIRGKRGFRVYLGKVYHGFFKAKADARAEVKKINATRASSSAGPVQAPVLMTHKHVLRTTVKGKECFRAVVRERNSRKKVSLGTTASIAGAANLVAEYLQKNCARSQPREGLA